MKAKLTYVGTFVSTIKRPHFCAVFFIIKEGSRTLEGLSVIKQFGELFLAQSSEPGTEICRIWVGELSV